MFDYGTTSNNGNVLSQTITAPGLSVAQNYLYDGVNRICAAAEAGSVGPLCADPASGAWYEKFGRGGPPRRRRCAELPHGASAARMARAGGPP